MATHYFNRPGGSLAYDDHGTGPLVLCLPSLGDVRGEYRLLRPRLLQAGYRVVTLDLRGHGESSVGWDDYGIAALGGDVVALLRELDAGPATIVGTSLSAATAAWVAAETPELVSGLVLISPFVRDMLPVWVGKLLFAPLFSGPWGPALWTRYYATLYPTAKPADFDSYLAALRGTLRQPGRMAALRGLLFASKRPAEERLEQVQAPTLVLMGSRDPDFKQPAAEAELVARRLRGRAQLIAGAGHYPHAEMPEVTAPLIVDFVRQTHAEARYAA